MHLWPCPSVHPRSLSCVQMCTGGGGARRSDGSRRAGGCQGGAGGHGGRGGHGFCIRPHLEPQSVQSVPTLHTLNSAPSPPSSQLASNAYWH
eukprot:2611038-Prymnesium_polylepis.2